MCCYDNVKGKDLKIIAGSHKSGSGVSEILGIRKYEWRSRTHEANPKNMDKASMMLLMISSGTENV